MFISFLGSPHGLPERMQAVQAALMNEAVTLFRRKYCNNGSHAGFILHLTDPQTEAGNVAALGEVLPDNC
ncbi:hypothetical protein CEK00_20965 [Stenotrophomonas maltophilia]|uniref:Uncharacterized protein n=1 Tax=Stenotrophomonas maltophilia TaxID=40324 RepID=A0A270MX02_STEMA|nr:hypothetical protein CEK00_22525 [Stenotrophomonas maltophilia]PAM66637.1 hypothetical protein CEK00_20965 [Stenotrophomonas maltophilia]